MTLIVSVPMLYFLTLVLLHVVRWFCGSFKMLDIFVFIFMA